MFVDCLDCPLRKTSEFRPMSDAELAFVRETKHGEREIMARSDIIVRGDPGGGVYTLFSGWAFRYMMLRDGCRQILDILLPGDLLGLQASIIGKIRHSVRAITNVRVCSLDSDRFHYMFKAHAALAEALVATLLIEEHRADTRLLMLGRQRPTERLGYLLLELGERLQRRGEDVSAGYALPLSYEHLADTIGVSRSQIGASLREVQARHWAGLAGGYLTFGDVDKMRAECDYMPLPDPGLRTLI